MTDDQEIVADIYGWSAVGVLLIVVLSFLWGWYIAFRSLFRGTYESCGDDQNIAFSDVPSINGYVPQVASAVFSYPLLACNIDISTRILNDESRPPASSRSDQGCRGVAARDDFRRVVFTAYLATGEEREEDQVNASLFFG
jgi:hypothetical protein